MQRRGLLFAGVVFHLMSLLAVSASLAQVNTATLTGVVTDQQGGSVRGAKVTLTSAVTGSERTVTVDDEGSYTIVGIVPGEYKVHVEGGSNFAPFENPAFRLTVGQKATLDVKLTLGATSQTVTVTTESAPVETTRSESAQTVDERQIDNLPINGRNYINFTLTNSQVTRDNSNAIGPAPNSGLSISGARARGNMVSVDGADAVDNSVNGIRSTVSQEAVQEFQMILSNYNPEYGRASGGVVNIVTKSGTNDFHGDVYGFLRNSRFQARNPFSFQVDPTTGDLNPIKQAYTRVQTGATFGGPLKKDKTFYFFSYEYTQREETGFSSIGQGNFGLAPLNCGGCQLQGLPLTSDQATAVTQLLQAAAAAPPAEAAQIQKLAGTYATLMGSASSVATSRLDFGAVAAGISGGLLKPGPGPQFPIPVSCPAGQMVNLMTCSPYGIGVAPLPSSFVALNAIRGNFPVMEKTSLWSARLDHHWNARNTSFIRVGVSPSNLTGIQSTSQNQTYGQNAGTRVGSSHYRDVNATFQHDTILSDTAFNEFRFQFSRRGVHFGYSPLDYSSTGGGTGSDIGVNIPGYAYFGREPYSTVDRIERRWQFADNGTITHGRHTFKVGVDFNLIQLRSKKQQIFELDFGGVANFSGLTASTFGLPDCFNLATGPHTGACSTGEISLPGTTTLQSYGLGLPTTYIQGIGSSNQPFDNFPIAFFAQDSWRVTRKLTLNYGLRYDLEISPLFAPATSINAAAEKALGVTEGIPRDYKNIAPRIGLAWDPTGDGKTVVRAGYGLFYDHPLLAIAFDSVTADGGRSVQLISSGSSASACGLLTVVPVCGGGKDTPLNLNGSSIFQGVLNANSVPSGFPSMYYLPNEQRFNPFPTNSLFANQNYLTAGFPLPILPFTLPVDKNFRYGYAQQANLTVERVIAGTWKISGGYQWSRGIHLNRPVDINTVDPALLTANEKKAEEIGLAAPGGYPLSVAVPATINASCGGIPAANISGGGSIAFAASPTQPLAPGALGLGYTGPNCTGTSVGFVATPAFFNYFRKSGPNPSFATGVGLAAPQCAGNPNPFSCGYAVQQALAGAAGFPVGFGVPAPYFSVDTQKSDASSWYNALTINLQKSFSKHFTLLSSYTWSHSLDNGTDLQSTLEPADSRFPQYERGNSVNDQRHRWVTSAVFQSSPYVSGGDLKQQLFSNWTLAPLVEWSSGRPFNIITGSDTLLDGGASEIRPQAGGATASSYIHGASFGIPGTCWTNTAQPYTIANVTPPYGCTGDLGRDKFTMPSFFQFDMRISKGINFGERLRLDLIADMFNLFNHTNIIAVNQLCDPTAGSTCFAGQPTAAADARQFQFALKLSW
jgi:Carboxypeptidase regulatory-like domain/TonB dependent receptor